MQLMINALRNQLGTVSKISADAVVRFFKNLYIQKGEEKIYVEFALQVMENFKAEQGFLVAHYCGKLIEEYDDGSSIERVKKIRNNLPALSGLRDYRVDYDLLISILNSIIKGECICISKTQGNTSPYEELYNITSSNIVQAQYTTYYIVECKKCLSQFEVQEEQGYHYPIYRWNKKN
jgi:hypothetical protein